MYLGDGKHCAEFAKQFLEKRSKWRSAQRPQAQADDLCKPAPAINPNVPADFQTIKVCKGNKCRTNEVTLWTEKTELSSANEFASLFSLQSKAKKPKKGKMIQMDSRMLGFNVMSAPDRINVGDRDYGEGA